MNHTSILVCIYYKKKEKVVAALLNRFGNNEGINQYNADLVYTADVCYVDKDLGRIENKQWLSTINQLFCLADSTSKQEIK